MAFTCDVCGFRSSELKAGGGVSAKGRRITLRLEDADDLNRDILKSDTAGVEIPELDLNVTHGTLGGVFTTVEGLLRKILEQLSEKMGYLRGDSATPEVRERFEALLARLSALSCPETFEPFDLVLDDPLANSFIQNYYAPDPDPAMLVEDYARSIDIDEELGLAFMCTEDYGEIEEQAAAAATAEAEASA
eukprot:gnl/Ergobibamus_cyprinoides/1466.p1 GENE.gnl/Ergobibamus_cyprinoides/1466~~gnl/Ergobibamus_cyprinoides/1466.p1  ORF type:complete len:191 (+),score=79.22 gnl/Ergobibamus_cyprinoides/1466:62-634(+)